jgi:hypothetical protein
MWARCSRVPLLGRPDNADNVHYVKLTWWMASPRNRFSRLVN